MKVWKKVQCLPVYLKKETEKENIKYRNTSGVGGA